jgi:hypothetical protein
LSYFVLFLSFQNILNLSGLNFVPSLSQMFVLLLSYFCPSGFKIFLFCPSIFYKMFRICIFCPIFVLLLSLCSNFLSLFCPTFVPIFAQNFHQWFCVILYPFCTHSVPILIILYLFCTCSVRILYLHSVLNVITRFHKKCTRSFIILLL